MKIIRKILYIALFMFISPNLHAIEYKAGTTGIRFLSIVTGARQSAMGESVAVLSDANSVFNNPATLMNMKLPEVSLTHNQWIADISEQSFSGVYPMKNGSLGVGVLYLHMDELTGYDIDSEGEPVRILNFTSYDIAGIVSYSKNIFNLSAGLSLKLFQEKLEEEKVTSAAVDIGVYKKLFNKLKVGGVIQNLGPSVKFIEEKTKLPLNFKLGVGYALPMLPLLITADIDKPIDNDIEKSFGAEYKLGNILDLRAGYQLGNDYREGVSLGVGIKITEWTLDYAFIPYGKCDDVHRISLIARLGATNKKENRDINKSERLLDEEKTKIAEEKRLIAEERAKLAVEKEEFAKAKEALKLVEASKEEKTKPLDVNERYKEIVTKKPGVVAIVNAVDGKLEIKPYGEKMWQETSPGTFLFEGDDLRTDNKSKAAITFVNGVEVKINESSKFTLSLPSKEKEIKDSIDLHIGEIFSKVKRKGTKFRIKTKTAIATVRGTEFNVKCYPTGKTNIAVAEGIVDVSNELGKIDVVKNMLTSVSPGLAPKKLRKINIKKIIKWQYDLKIDENLKFDISKLSAEIPKLKIEGLIEELNKEKGVTVKKEESEAVIETKRQIQEQEQEIEKKILEVNQEKKNALERKNTKEEEFAKAETEEEKEKIETELKKETDLIETIKDKEQKFEKEKLSLEEEKKKIESESSEKIKIITTEEAVQFDFDSASFPVDDLKVLTKIADLLRAFPNKEVIIEGHTDSVGDEKYNIELSLKRAEMIKRYFVEIENFSPDKFKTIGIGSSNPIVTNKTKEGRSQNRRVEIVLE